MWTFLVDHGITLLTDSRLILLYYCPPTMLREDSDFIGVSLSMWGVGISGPMSFPAGSG